MQLAVRSYFAVQDAYVIVLDDSRFSRMMILLLPLLAVPMTVRHFLLFAFQC